MVHLLFVVLGVLLLVVRLMFADPYSYPFSPGSVVGVFGRQGSGKSVYLTSLALAAALDGRPIAANYPIDFGSLPVDFVFFRSWSELDSLRGRVILLDEAHLWAPSWDNSALSTSNRALLSQLRKRRCSFVYAAQHPARVAKTLRELSTDVVLANRIGVFLMLRYFDPDEFGLVSAPKSGVKPLQFRLSPLDSLVITMYDTGEAFAPSGS